MLRAGSRRAGAGSWCSRRLTAATRCCHCRNLVLLLLLLGWLLLGWLPCCLQRVHHARGLASLFLHRCRRLRLRLLCLLCRSLLLLLNGTCWPLLRLNRLPSLLLQPSCR